MSKKNKLFIENMLFFGGLTMLTKSIPLITLPIITSLLADASDYGTMDLFSLLTSFGSAIAICGMYDAMFREYFEYENDLIMQKKITSTGLIITLTIGTFLLLVLTLFAPQLNALLFNNSLSVPFIYLAAINIIFAATVTILSAPTRMKNNKKVFLYTGVSIPIINFMLTLLFIYLGFTFEALIFSNVIISILSVFIYVLLNYAHFDFRLFDKKIAKSLLKIGIPLLPTFLIYWVFNSMDRLMINDFLGSAELGVYSVGSKLASVSQLIYTAFAGGWSYFSFSTMKDDNQVEYTSKIFMNLGIISIIAFIFAQPFIQPVFNLLFSGTYVRGAEVFAFLFLSPLMLMLFQIIANQTIIFKKSYLSTVALVLGAILNVILNIYLIPKYGIKGAAFSTLVGYLISVIIMLIICYKQKWLKINFKFIGIFALMFLSILIDLIFGNPYSSAAYIVLLILITIIYAKDIKLLFLKFRRAK